MSALWFWAVLFLVIGWPLMAISYHLGELVKLVREIVLMYQLQGAAGPERQAAVERAMAEAQP